LISGGFQAPPGAEPPWKEKKIKPPPGQFLNTPLEPVANVVNRLGRFVKAL